MNTTCCHAGLQYPMPLKASATPTVPDASSAAKPIMVICFTMSCLNMYALWAMPSADMGMQRNTNLDTSVSSGWWKKRAMSGAQKKRTA